MRRARDGSGMLARTAGQSDLYSCGHSVIIVVECDMK